MTTYNVHVYREMRLVFGGIEAASPEEAAALARDKPTENADEFDDECDGETFYALVDVQGDEQHEQSRFIDFEPERLRLAAPKLLEACRMVIGRWEDGDLEEAAGPAPPPSPRRKPPLPGIEAGRPRRKPPGLPRPRAKPHRSATPSCCSTPTGPTTAAPKPITLSSRPRTRTPPSPRRSVRR